MIVVAIIGLLAAIAIPQFLRFSWKSKRAEAWTLAKTIHTSQTAYFSSYDHFAFGNGNNLILNNELGIGAINQGKYYQFQYATNNSNPVTDPKATMDYIAALFGNIDDNANPADDDRLAIKNGTFAGVTGKPDNDPFLIYDDILDKFL